MRTDFFSVKSERNYNNIPLAGSMQTTNNYKEVLFIVEALNSTCCVEASEMEESRRL